jgi:hypothetical protein
MVASHKYTFVSPQAIGRVLLNLLLESRRVVK